LESLDTEHLLGHYADDAVFESAASGNTFKGQDALRAYFTRLFSLPGVHFKVDSVFGSPEMGAIEWTWSGLSAHSQTPFHIRGASIFKHTGAKITHEIIYYDPAPSLA
jgi:ketosteroid isomerase-like protein